MQKRAYVNINGDIVSKEDAKISIFDRGFLFGDSVFEVTLAYGSSLYLFDEHLDRLWSSAKGVYMNFNFSREELIKEVLRTLNKAQFQESYVRIIVTRGEGEISLDPGDNPPTTFIIIVKEHFSYPQKWYQEGVKLVVADVLRNDQRAISPSIKSSNYLNSFLAYMAVKKTTGAHESIMLNVNGFVTECSTSNIWMVRNNEILTPPLSIGILDGITRRKILDICNKEKILVVEKNFTLEELKNADECFITSSTRRVLPVSDIDQTKIGSDAPGPCTRKIMELYNDFIYKYSNELLF